MSEQTVDTRKCGTCGIFRLTTIIAPDTRACPECGLQRRPMDFEAAKKPAEPQPDAQVPSLWRFTPCKIHSDFDWHCSTCQEEVLTTRLEKAYLAGYQAAEQRATRAAIEAVAKYIDANQCQVTGRMLLDALCEPAQTPSEEER